MIRRRIPLFFAGFTLFFAGLLVGVVIAGRPRVPPSVIREDRRPGVPLVRIDGVEGGLVTGTIRGSARLLIAGNVVDMAGSGGTFRVSAGEIAALLSGRAPPGMQFVASKRGKKYYPVASKSAQNLSPANRVYFKTAAEAVAAGYRP